MKHVVNKFRDDLTGDNMPIAKVKKGWYGEGKQVQIIGDDVNVNGMTWTPVLYDDEEDPTFVKSSSLEIISEPEESLTEKRAKAIEWWNKLPLVGNNYSKYSFTNKYHGQRRMVGSLTGREIQNIYENERK